MTAKFGPLRSSRNPVCMTRCLRKGTNSGGHGTSLASVVAVAVLAVLSLGTVAPISVSQKSTKNKPYALLFGTVFNEDGRLVRGARVVVKPKETKGKWETGSDNQGEFAVHLPVGKAVYILEVQAPGLAPAKKEVTFEGEERQDVVVHLKRQ